jgi:hypothetical protein
VNASLKKLENIGIEVTRVKNTFLKNSPYKGVNVNLKSKSGNIFELQFHTPDSFNIKQNINHVLYEEARDINISLDRVREIEKIMIENNAKIKIPDSSNLILNK